MSYVDLAVLEKQWEEGETSSDVETDDDAEKLDFQLFSNRHYANNPPFKLVDEEKEPSSVSSSNVPPFLVDKNSLNVTRRSLPASSRKRKRSLSRIEECEEEPVKKKEARKKRIPKSHLKFNELFGQSIVVIKELKFEESSGRNKNVNAIGFLFSFITRVIRTIQKSHAKCENLLFDGAQFTRCFVNTVVQIGPECPIVGDEAICKVWYDSVYTQAVSKSSPFGMNAYLNCIRSNNATQLKSNIVVPISKRCIVNPDALSMSFIQNTFLDVFNTTTPCSYGTLKDFTPEFLFIYNATEVAHAMPTIGSGGTNFYPTSVPLRDGRLLCIRESPSAGLNFALGNIPAFMRETNEKTQAPRFTPPSFPEFSPADLEASASSAMKVAIITTLASDEECKEMFHQKAVPAGNKVSDCTTCYKPPDLDFSTKYLKFMETLQASKTHH